MNNHNHYTWDTSDIFLDFSNKILALRIRVSYQIYPVFKYEFCCQSKFN